MRNLAAGNKMRFTMFTFIVIIILIMLIIAIVMALGYDKTEYQVLSSAFLYDSEYNHIELNNTATVTKKWTGKYYLKEDGTNKEYKLGDYGISYEKTRNSLDLYGTFYQVLANGDVNKLADFNTINSSFEDKFYKMGDRQYLIVARNIRDNTGSLSTSNYLIVIMDKLGNALLLNNEVNAKTIKEMTISTDDYKFDVANEILTFKDEQIHLKNLIGSTNEHKEKENVVDENSITGNNINGEFVDNTVIANGGNTTNTTNNNNNNSTTIINGSGNSSTNTKWVNSLNKWVGNVSKAFENIYNNETSGNKDNKNESTKSIGLNSVIGGTTYIDVNYTVNDPKNEYNVVYIVVSNGTNINKNISLDKKATSYRVTDLDPDTNYTVRMGYKIVNADATSKDVIEDMTVTKTTKPSENLRVTKVGLDKIYYNLKIDSSFVYDGGAKIKVYVDGTEDEALGTTLTKDQLHIAASGTGYELSFKRPEYSSSIKIELTNTKYDGNKVNSNVSTTIMKY